MHRRVDIGRKVDYKTLETALVKAAEEVGWKAQIEDTFNRSYKLDPFQETKDYDGTMVHLRGRVFSAIKVRIPDKNPSNMFFVWQGSPNGWASERKVQEYLGAVSRNLLNP